MIHAVLLSVALTQAQVPSQAPAGASCVKEQAQAQEAPWALAKDGDVKVYARERPGGRVKEVKAEAVVDCSAQEFVSVLVDENPKKKTPYVAEARVVDRPDANTKIKYTHLAFPIIDDRDYFIIVHVDQNLDANGKGVYRANWKPWGLDRPARDGIVRVTTNEGFWEVKSIEGEPSKCSATYYLYSDPGGALPAWIIDQGNKRVLPDVIHAIYKDVLEKRAAQGVGGGGASK